MKPVNKGNAQRSYRKYRAAKPDLVEKLGAFCSYCEIGSHANSLHVEHMYPKDPHPEKECEWENFLLSCPTCNSYKNLHLGNFPQSDLEARFLWPHLDNTSAAFDYFDDGRVEICGGLEPAVERAAEATREMVGLMKSPAVAVRYQDVGVAYDGITGRREMWEIATDELNDYLESPIDRRAASISKRAARMGFFSVWMNVFRERPEVVRELVRAFKADASCFDENCNAVRKGRL